MFTEIRSSWKIRGLNPVFVCWQGDAGKTGTWAFLPKGALLSPAPNCLIFPQAAAGCVTFLCVSLVGCSLGQTLQLLIGVTVQMGCWRCWHGKNRPTSLECVAPLLSSYTTFLWRMSGLWRQSWFEGCDTLVGWPIRDSAFDVTEPSGEMLLLQHVKISAEFWEMARA